MKKSFALSIAVAIVAASACDDGPCIPPPCPPPTAAIVTVTAATTGTVLSTAFVQEIDPSSGQLRNTYTCQATCYVYGVPGTLRLVIGAPGYTSQERTFIVKDLPSGPCQCENVDVAHVSVALDAASP